jgi:16S rRNA (cytidine1402-2'-O)-methyltransferase
MGTLYVVATPIGNLEDVTLRALRVLREADLLLAEDTRRTRTLLEHHAIPARPQSLHAHNESARVQQVLDALAAGQGVALVSDAGTPLISDPGERLVARVVEAGHPVVPVPGASAPMAALAASGLPASPFLFVGFLPRRKGERQLLLERLATQPETLVFFESPRRVAATLAELADRLGPRRACIARELTKLHEEFTRGALPELAARAVSGIRGEVTLVVEGAQPALLSEQEVERQVALRVAAGDSPKEVAASLAQASGRPRRELYALALRARQGGGV